MSSRAVISHEQGSKRKYGSAVCQHRIEQQGEQQSGSILAQPRNNGHQKPERESPVGRHGGVDQSGNQPREAKRKHVLGMAQLYIDIVVHRPRSANERLSSDFTLHIDNTTGALYISHEQRGEHQGKAYWRSHTSTTIRKLTAKAVLDDTAMSTRAVISRETQSKSIYGAAVYQNRVEQQSEQQTGSILTQPRINSDQKTEHESPAGRHDGVEQSGNQPPAANKNIYGAAVYQHTVAVYYPRSPRECVSGDTLQIENITDTAVYQP